MKSDDVLGVIQMGVLFLEVCYSHPKERQFQHGYPA
jgi:hypothetical protein